MINQKSHASKLSEPENFAFFLIPVILILSVRWFYVENFAASLPFWDQWDAEGASLLKPWVEGKLTFNDLWRPHNEHRIFPTRLMTLLNYTVTSEWNNLWEARWNVVIATLIPAYMLWGTHLYKAENRYFFPMALLIVAQAVLPFGWENFLVGFQSQIYFLVLFTVLAIGLAASGTERLLVRAGIVGLSILSMLTMASGLLTPMVVVIVLLIISWQNKEIVGRDRWLIAVLSFVIILAAICLPANKAHEGMRAQNIHQFFEAACYVFSWPMRSGTWLAFFLWVPVILIPWLMLRREMSRTDFFMTGCLLWTVAAGLSIAFGRGHGLIHLTSRYTDFLTPGLVASSWFAIRWAFLPATRRFTRFGRISIAVLFYTVYVRAQVMRFKADVHDMRKHQQLAIIQTRNVQQYLESGDSLHLQQPPFHIPYPDAVRLKLLLDDPTTRLMLPASNTEEP